MWKETQNSVECYINFLCFDLEKDIRTYFQVFGGLFFVETRNSSGGD